MIFNFYYRPVLYLPSPQKATVAVRCCPILFELRQDNGNISLLSFHFFVCKERKISLKFSTRVLVEYQSSFGQMLIECQSICWLFLNRHSTNTPISWRIHRLTFNQLSANTSAVYLLHLPEQGPYLANVSTECRLIYRLIVVSTDTTYMYRKHHLTCPSWFRLGNIINTTFTLWVCLR